MHHLSRRAVLAGLSILPLSACTSTGVLSIAPASAASDRTEVVKLGETEVRLVIRGSGTPTFIALHQSEPTSVRAAEQVRKRTGGTLVILKHGEKGTERNVSFTVNGAKYEIDPNRIFTDAGIRLNLLPRHTREARTEVVKLAEAIKKHLRGLIVALHNNSNRGSYSFDSYAPGGNEANNATMYEPAKGQDLDNFVFTTVPNIFEKARAAGFNAALQSGWMKDDGSLSAFSSRRYAYVNVEAEHGSQGQQVKMLLAVLE